MMRFNPRQPDAATGFTLIELLMAMFILALGLVGVVSVFPVSAYLQRAALNQVITSSMTDSIRALCIGRGFDTDDPDFPNITDGNVTPLGVMLGVDGDWPVELRSVGNDGLSRTGRPYYWVPLIRDAAGGSGQPDWELYVFILARQSDATYTAEGVEQANDVDAALDPENSIPQVVRYEIDDHTDNRITVDIPPQDSGLTILRPGDPFLTQDGRVMRAASVTPGGGNPTVTVTGLTNDEPADDEVTSIWCAPHAPNKSRGPTLRILAFGSEAVK